MVHNLTCFSIEWIKSPYSKGQRLSSVLCFIVEVIDDILWFQFLIAEVRTEIHFMTV